MYDDPIDWYDALDINFLREDYYEDDEEYTNLREYWLDERADAYHDYMSDEEYDND